MKLTFLRYLMASTAMFAPPDRPTGGQGDPPGDQGGDDDQIDVELEEDPDNSDPDDEPGEGEGDADDDEDEPEGDEGAGGRQEPARQSRGDRQFGELRRQARERAEENARLTRELAELRGQIAAVRQPPAETPQQRAERMALLTPEERMDVRLNEALEANNQRQAQLTAQLMDQSDRNIYAARAAANPLFKKLEAKVEAKLAELRQRGENLPRETIATYLIGEQVVAQQASRGGRQQPSRRQRETTRPARGGSDVQPQRGARRGVAVTAEDYEAQFGDVSI